MKRLDTSASLFGLDLRQLQRDWLLALTGITQWPFFRWLAPTYITRIHSPGGDVADYVENAGRVSLSSPPAKRVKFSGVLLPDDIVLWHTMVLPKLRAEAIDAAVALQVKSLSPFPEEDVIWAYSNAAATQDGKTHVAIASRRIIAQHIAAVQTEPVAAKKLEVWVKAPESGGMLVLNGFGEKWRRQLAARWWLVNLFLVFVLVMLTLAAALTPTAQLRFRTIQATQDYANLQVKAAPALQQREQLSKLEQQVKALQDQFAQSQHPELVMRQITKLLPDDTYLLSLQMQGGKILLTGQTPNTAALMQQLGAQPGIKDVRAPTAAVKPRGAERETFNIELTLDPSSLIVKP